MSPTTLAIIAAVAATAIFVLYRVMTKGRPRAPAMLRPGNKLPEFDAVDESGAAVRSTDLAGSPAIILFVRGNWCPFCTKQVKNLAGYYKRINELGARLIFITPKPLDTTRRVAEFFEIEFDFWLDQDLRVTRQLGLFLPAGVPGDSRAEYGDDTVWPTSLVVDSDNVIRFTSLSKFIFDRPRPDELVKELEKL